LKEKEEEEEEGDCCCNSSGQCCCVFPISTLIIKRTSKIAVAIISGFISSTNNFHDDLLIKPERRIDQNTIRS
jgi:hypothetical protein